MDMAVETTQQEIAEALARSGIYQFLSNAFFYPQADFFKRISEGKWAEALVVATSVAENEQLKSSLRAGIDALFSTFSAGSLADLEKEYQRAFSHTTTEIAPPYETQYGTAHIFQQMQAMGDIGGFYKAFGLERSDDAKERLDHIAIELEFMYFLTYKEAYALANHGREKGEMCREAQKQFLGEHLGRWAPLFTKLLKEKVGGGFYAELAAFTDHYLKLEMNRLGIQSRSEDRDAPQFSDVRSGIPRSGTVGIELDESCLTCGVADAMLAEPYSVMRET